jgi:CheY-like chemotaxis protein
MAGDQHKRILIVDDDPGVRQLLGNVLRQRSLIVDEAAGGNEAIEFMRQNRYAVILLDLLMPDTDGFGVLEAIRTQDLNSPPVVLVLTGADRSTIDRLDAQIIHGIVRKPFDTFEVASIVVACSEIKFRGSLEAMALAIVSGAPLLDLLRRFGG